MPVYTKTANDVFAPTDSGGHARGPSPQDAQTWGTEVEGALEDLDGKIVDFSTPPLGLNVNQATTVIITSGQSLEVSHGPAYDYPTLGVYKPTIDNNTYAYDRASGIIRHAATIGANPYVEGIVSPQQIRTSELARLTRAPVYDVPNAQGGLSILNWTNPIEGSAAPTTDMWSRLTTDMDAVKGILGSGIKVSYFFWNQGESDNSQTVDWYYHKLHDVLLPALRSQSWWSPTGRIVLQGKGTMPMVMTGEYSVENGSGTITRSSGDTFGNLADLSTLFPMKVRVWAPDGSNNGDYTVSAVAGNEESATFSPDFSTTETKAMFLTIDARDHRQDLPNCDAALRMCADTDEDVSYTPLPLGARTLDGQHMDGMTSYRVAVADLQRAITAPAYIRVDSPLYFEKNTSFSIYPRGSGGVAFEDVRDFGEALEKNGKVKSSGPFQALHVYLEDGDHEFNEWYLISDIWRKVWLTGRSGLQTTSNQSTNKMPTYDAFSGTEATDLGILRDIFPARLMPSGTQGIVIACTLGKMWNLMVDGSDATRALVVGDNTNNVNDGCVNMDTCWVHGASNDNILVRPGCILNSTGGSNGPKLGSSYSGSAGISNRGTAVIPYAASFYNGYGLLNDEGVTAHFRNGTAKSNSVKDLYVNNKHSHIIAVGATYSTSNTPDSTSSIET